MKLDNLIWFRTNTEFEENKNNIPVPNVVCIGDDIMTCEVKIDYVTEHLKLFRTIGYDRVPEDAQTKTIEELTPQVEYSKTLYDAWGPATTSASSKYSNDKVIVYAPKIDTSNVTNMGSMFTYCSSLTTVPLFDTSNVTDMSGMFYQCHNLTTVPLFDTSKVTSVNSMFYRCSNLTTLGGFTNLKCDLDLSSCTNLTKESILNVFNEAATIPEAERPKKLTLGQTNLNKLTEEEKAIATNKGWTLK